MQRCKSRLVFTKKSLGLPLALAQNLNAPNASRLMDHGTAFSEMRRKRLSIRSHQSTTWLKDSHIKEMEIFKTS